MIKALFISRQAGGLLQQVDSFDVVAGAGVVGDRNFNKTNWPGQNITFIEMEAIEVFNRDKRQSIAFDATRRNVITTGVDLNALVGKVFLVGGVRFKGVELCEPCKALGDQLANEKISSSNVVKAFLNRGGLRADICSDGELSTGMDFIVDQEIM
ncbi:MAG: hypothetical protein JKY01_14285 [Pseudomonadales bacterium]|nr:hypothetical protein [Pseudomonadales bacterium]